MMNGIPRGKTASSASSASSGSGSSKHVRCIGRYVLTGTTLGKGNFARVEASVHTLTRSKVAVKIIETDKIKEEYVRKNLLREAQLMRRLRHPNIIRLYETMKTSNLYCLVTEVAEGGELLAHVRNDFKEKRLSEATTRPFIRQLVSALHHLHTAGIVHRDLKMENILLDRRKKQVKIVDFGLSNVQLPGSLLQTHCGSPEYAAPELFIPGREYGPEVDVWSLGVNMYAMLVGKLPFRSPRQGSKRRQKLLEQIQSGLSDGHEKDLSHVTTDARNLLGKLLQPSPKHRARLTEVMEHPWITKDGSQPLYPYKYTPPDQNTQKAVVELMSTFLEVSPSEIRDAVKRDRCDWMAAIYNLLMDQPDGRVVMQRLLSSGPEDQLVDAAHYQGTMEHFRLSQDASSATTPTDVAHAITASVAGGSHSRAGYRHSMAGDHKTGYPSSTLPLTKQEKKRQHEPHPPRQPLNPVQPPPALRRASIGIANITPSYPITEQGGLSQPLPISELPPGSRGGRRLPVTPSEAPFQVQTPFHDSHRPHSRAESEPNPLPLPWRSSLVQKLSGNDGVRMTSPLSGGSPSSSPPHTVRTVTDTMRGGASHYGNPPPLVSPLTHIEAANKKKRNSGFLRPVRPGSVGGVLNKKISSSMDANLDSRGQPQGFIFQDPSRTLSGARKRVHRGQIGPSPNPGDQPHPILGWSSISQMGSLPRRSRDIEALMRAQLPTSPYSSVQDIHTTLDGGRGSITSIDIKQDMFSTDHGRMGVSPYGSTRVSPHGSTTVSPHGSTRVSPHGSTRVSPHESTTVSPHQSMRFSSPEGSRVTSPRHSRVMMKSHENLKMDLIGGGETMTSKRHHRSISANPMMRGQSSDYYNDMKSDGIPNGVHPLPDPYAHASRHRHDDRHQRSAGHHKSRRHTHSGHTHSGNSRLEMPFSQL